MTPTRAGLPGSSHPNWRQTAAPPQPFTGSGSSGCLSGFLLPPLAVLLVGLLLAAFSSRLSLPARAGSPLPAAGQTSGVSLFSPGLAPLYTPEVQHWSERILAWAAQTGLEANLIATVMQIESCGDPRARSRAGAMGLFQVMPYHFYEAEDSYDPEINALRGLAYLQKSLDKANGDVDLAFAGYNGGISVISRPQSSWADETIRYVYWGGGIYRDAVQGTAYSARLEEWLGRGGASLCQQARHRLGISNQ